MDEMEQELREAFERHPAPAGLKRKIMERRWLERSRKSERVAWFERLAASLVLAGVAGGAAIGHYAEEQRRGEEAKQKVFTALRITGHALNQVNRQLRENDAR